MTIFYGIREHAIELFSVNCTNGIFVKQHPSVRGNVNIFFSYRASAHEVPAVVGNQLVFQQIEPEDFAFLFRGELSSCFFLRHMLSIFSDISIIAKSDL